MLGIYYLKLTKAAINAGSKIHDHYVLMSKAKFFVMTSKPVINMKLHYIGTPNIAGEQKPQYIIEHAHNYDPNKHLIAMKTEAVKYYIEHQEKFQKVLEILNQSN